MSLRARLLLVLTVLAGAGLITAAAATYTFERSFLQARLDRTIAGSATSLAASLNGPRGALDHSDVGSLESATPGIVVLRLNGSGAPVPLFTKRGDADDRAPAVATPDPYREPRLPKTISTATRGRPITITSPATAGDARYRTRVQPLLRDGGYLVVAAPLGSNESALRHLLVVEALVSSGALALIVILALYLVRVGLRPLARIEQTAIAIAAGDLSRRVEGVDDRTEVGRLGGALNAMLGTIESSFAQRVKSEERLRRFVADASHELRTPLASVQAYAELFERGARDHPDDLERAMGGISREARRMSLIVEDLLLLARLDEGVPLDEVRIDLVAVCEEAVEVARMLEPRRSLTLRASGPAFVLGDPVRIRQVLDNLLANIRAHTPLASPALVTVEHAHGQVVAVVEDHGAGIAPDLAEKVFERFFRSDRSRSRTSGGSGLGLAVVAAIVDAHGGRAAITRTLGGGATVRIILPAAPSGSESEGQSWPHSVRRFEPRSETARG